MRASESLAIAFASVVALPACNYDFDGLCRTGEVCGAIEVTPPVTREPNVGQGPSCSIYRARCGDESLNQACSFRISGGSVDAPPECRSSSGSSSDGRSCADASFCSIGFTCFRTSTAETNGVCVDLCQTVNDCEGVSRTCDRSAPVTTLDGVPIYRCIDTGL